MQKSGWMLDELTYAGEEHLDIDYVKTYDAKAQTDPTEDLRLLCDLGLEAESTVVDLGAGTGTFVLAVAPLCRRVVGVDVSSAMIATMEQRARQLGLTNVEPVHAGFLSYEHQGEQADFVFSRNALHHLPDFWKVLALGRIAGMLKSGGVLRLHDLVYSFDLSGADQTIEKWLSGGVKSPDLGWTRAELETHVRTEYSTFDWLLEPMLERAGFEIRQAEHRPSKTYSAYTCVKS